MLKSEVGAQGSLNERVYREQKIQNIGWRLASGNARYCTQTSADGGRLSRNSADVCPTRFKLGGDSKSAAADGVRVIIGDRFPGFDYPTDELAAAIAHEFAHNLLEHPAWLDTNGRKLRNIRLTEREADRLMPWLLANAGFDPSAGVRFMQRWGPKHDGGLFRRRTHDGWDERVEFIQTEVSKIDALRESKAEIDWSALFEREIAP